MSTSEFEQLRKLLYDAVGDEAFLCREMPILDYGGLEYKKMSNALQKSDTKMKEPFISTLKESNDSEILSNEINFQRLNIRQDGSTDEIEGSEFSVIEDSLKFL